MAKKAKSKKVGDHADYDLEVGYLPYTHLHWIGVDRVHFGRTISTVSGRELHAVKIHRNDIPWLIKSLQKELRLAKKRDSRDT